MKKQTAVEWLHTKLSTCTSEELVGNINNWFDQAKAIEKEQIIDAYRTGWINYLPDKDSEQYYNETFGGDK